MRNYSDIHRKLVKNENDVIGHVAYSLYKKEKGAWIQDRKKEGATKPTEKEIQKYTNAISSSQATLNGYKNSAKRILTNYSGLVIQDYEEKKEKSDLDKIVASLHGFWYGVSQSLVAAVIFALITTLLLFIVRFGGYRLTIVPLEDSQKETQAIATPDNQIIEKRPAFELKTE